MNERLFLRCLLESGMIFPGMVYALLPVRGALRWREKTVWLSACAVTLALAVSGAAICAHLRWETNFVLAAFVPLCLLLYFRAVALPAAKKLFCFFNAAMLCSFCTLFANYLMGPVELGNESGVFMPVSGLVCLGLAAVLLALFFRTLTGKLPTLLDSPLLDGQWQRLALAPLALLALDIWMLPRYPAVVMTGRVRSVSLLLFFLLLLAVYSLMHLFWRIMTGITENARLAQENSLLKMEEKRFEELHTYLENARILRHDFRQHLLVLRDLNAAGNREGLSAYLEPLLETAEAKGMRLAENRALDAVVSHYARQAEAMGIALDWQLTLPEKPPFRETDLCAILGNLLENAVNAVQALPPAERKIRVRASMLSEAMLGLTVENPYAGEIPLGKNGLPVSARAGHGLGLASVAGAVKRYDGSLDFRAENGLCTVGVLLNAKVVAPPADL